MNNNIYFILLILIISVVAQLSLLTGMDWFQYSRADIGAGQWWRLITANLIHLSWNHLAMNALALIAIYLLYPRVITFKGWLSVFIMSCLAVTVGICCFSPEVYWYVGLSGVLHGILVVLLLLDFIMHKHRLNLILLLALIAKLIWEAVMGPMPGSEDIAGGAVIVQAHLYGFIGGLLIAACILSFKSNKNNKLY